MVKRSYGDRARLTPEIHRHYLAPLSTPDERLASWVFPRQIIKSSDWLSGLWERRSALATKRILLAWGIRDIAFRQQVLDDTGVDKQVLTFTSPGTHIEEPRLAATLAGRTSRAP